MDCFGRDDIGKLEKHCDGEGKSELARGEVGESEGKGSRIQM